ncbi:HD domain-containing protein [Paenibacillus athensensis]|uniref:HD domain-containing protein n=1 Tax=Paenibacillus athensensis TaxID=1967502 RepID=UPI00143159A3|nr:HD domain-containing protein [Paenibacillus athensensis]MCD1259589.1 HD domain-containing protein [Paenibacillus athensensis]
MSLQHTFPAGRIWEPLYRWETEAHPVEIELFRCRPVRRLKFLHHFGASALSSPMNHSRLEHTVGVWSLMARMLPGELHLRIAALLHDIGHLPFSHAVERTLGFNHHERTAELIDSGEVALILRKYGISPEAILTLLRQDSPLKNGSALMGLDHLDSFLRDTAAAGRGALATCELVHGLRLRGDYVEADAETALPLVLIVAEHHKLALAPAVLAMDALLAKAVSKHCEAVPGFKGLIPGMLDQELIYALQTSEAAEARALIDLLLYEPHRIGIHHEPQPGSIQVRIGRLQPKEPLVAGLPAAEASAEAAQLLAELDSLTRDYFITCP